MDESVVSKKKRRSVKLRVKLLNCSRLLQTEAERLLKAEEEGGTGVDS